MRTDYLHPTPDSPSCPVDNPYQACRDGPNPIQTNDASQPPEVQEEAAHNSSVLEKSTAVPHRASPKADGFDKQKYLDWISAQMREAYKHTAPAHGIVAYLGECGPTREDRPLFNTDGRDLSNE